MSSKIIKIKKPRKLIRKRVLIRSEASKPLWSASVITVVILLAIFAIFNILNYSYALFTDQEVAVDQVVTPAVESLSDIEEATEVAEIQKRLHVNDNPLGYLNVRAGPGTEYKLLWKANVGDIFHYTTFELGWYRIVDEDGRPGWVAEKYIELLD